jgi:hypothetical protein
MFIAIFVSLILFTFISYGFISHFIAKEEIEKSIIKKINSIGYELISIKTIEPPKFLEAKEEYFLFLVDPTSEFYTYKSVLIRNGDNVQLEGFVAIRKVIIKGRTYKYYFDLNNTGEFTLLK